MAWATSPVSSWAVPMGISIVADMRPSSCVGKYSVFILGAKMAITTAKMTMAPRRMTFLCCMHQPMRREYPADTASRALFTGPKMNLYSLLVVGLLLSSREHSVGTRVRAAVVDTIIMMDTIQPSWRNIKPVIPLIIVSGRNTHSIVRVDAITEIPTSDVPCTAASRGFSPRSRCVVTFSSTTIASSTTIPMAMASALIEMMLSVFPLASR